MWGENSPDSMVEGKGGDSDLGRGCGEEGEAEDGGEGREANEQPGPEVVRHTREVGGWDPVERWKENCKLGEDGRSPILRGGSLAITRS